MEDPDPDPKQPGDGLLHHGADGIDFVINGGMGSENSRVNHEAFPAKEDDEVINIDEDPPKMMRSLLLMKMVVSSINEYEIERYLHREVRRPTALFQIAVPQRLQQGFYLNIKTKQIMALADGKAAASQVIEKMAIPRPRKPLSTNDIDQEVLEYTRAVSGVRGAMNYHCKVGASAAADDKIRDIVESNLKRAEDLFSLWVEDSEVNQINKASRGEAIQLSDDMSGVLQAVDRLHALSGGMYDPCCFPLMQYYKKHLTEGMRGLNFLSAEKDPQQAAIAMYANWQAFVFSKDGKTLTKTHDHVAIDLGGIAKGWAIDRCIEALKDAGYKDIYFEWGGDVRVEGKHPSGRLWSVNIIEPPSLASLHALPMAGNNNKALKHSGLGGDPKAAASAEDDSIDDDGPVQKSMSSLNDTDQCLACIQLRGGSSLTTSGDYMQVFWFGDKLFHHVFQPKTKKLLEVSSTSLAQCSIILTGGCMYADAFATTVLAMGNATDARKFLDGLSRQAVPVEDYLLYVREGPHLIRRRIRGNESEAAREVRMSQHDAAHVIVIGGGLAGFAATIQAARSGAMVTLLEKEGRLGGNSAKATSGINAWGSRPQAEQGVNDEEKYFERDTFRSGKGGLCDPSLVRVLSTQSAEAIRWLMDEIGVDLTELSQLGGHARKRTHRAKPVQDGNPRRIGWSIMEAVQQYVTTHLSDKVTIMTGAKVTNLHVEVSHEGRKDVLVPRKTVTGVIYEDVSSGQSHTLEADGIVLCTGGYGCDFSSTSLLKKHRPDLLGDEKGVGGMPSTNGSFATGDGVKLGVSIGAEAQDLDKVQLHPTSFVDPKDPTNPTKILGPEALRGSGGILVNHEGRRFVNELDLRSKVSAAILKNCKPFMLPDGQAGNVYAWCILNEEAQRKFGLPALRFYKDARSLFESAPDFESLAHDVIGCNPAVLKQAIKDYAQASELQVDLKTQKNVFPVKFSWEDDKNLVAARVTPSIHYTMGGLRINAATEVLELARTDRQPTLYYRKLRPIRRLFGAGEVTSGVHGQNRLGGNSLLECVVFGRLAGERAATIKQRHKTCLRKDEWVPVQFREVLRTDKKYGINTMVFCFHLHGALQEAGLDVGQFIGIRGEQDGEILQGFYSPISRPNEQGAIEILCRMDTKGGQIIRFLNEVRPGEKAYLKAMGGLRLKFSVLENGRRCCTNDGREIKKIGLLAGGTGIAPMIQILRAYLYYLVGEGAPDSSSLPHPSESGVKLVYAAERDFDLAFTSMLEGTEERHPEYFSHYIVLNQSPLGWCDGVGFVDADTVKKYLFFPPAEDTLTVICGPPVFESIMCKLLASLGYSRHTYFAYSQPA